LTLPNGIQRDYELALHTSWRVGGRAEFFSEPESLESLKRTYTWALDNELPVTVLGSGTNVLVSDQGVSGLTLLMARLQGVESVSTKEGRLQIVAWAGSLKSEALKIFLQHKLSPALFLAGLPGDLGGGIVMNAGVGEKIVPREFCEITDWIEVLQPREGGGTELVRFSKKDLKWNYRKSEGWQPGVITRVALTWPMDQDPDLGAKLKQATRKRIRTQPLDKPSCGSTFRNPEGELSAGALIEKSGLKGFRAGQAYVSHKHANFIVTEEGACALDVHRVIEHVKSEVLAQFSVSLQTEVVYLGNWSSQRESL
jgi:UDP-N-acetylmuramate dehydrogenase